MFWYDTFNDYILQSILCVHVQYNDLLELKKSSYLDETVTQCIREIYIYISIFQCLFNIMKLSILDKTLCNITSLYFLF